MSTPCTRCLGPVSATCSACRSCYGPSGLCCNCNCVVWEEKRRLSRAAAACHALAAGLLGVCWGMAADALARNASMTPQPLCSLPVDMLQRATRWRAFGRMDWYYGGAQRWLLDQARPPGCRAPWEDQ